MRSKFKSPFMQTDRSQKASGLQKSKDSPKCLFVLLPESFAFCLPLRHPIEWDSPKFYPLTVVLQGSYRYSVFEKYVCIIAEKTQYDKTFFEICRIFPPVNRTKAIGKRRGRPRRLDRIQKPDYNNKRHCRGIGADRIDGRTAVCVPFGESICPVFGARQMK